MFSLVKHTARAARFRLATLFLITTACAVGLWWWQRPYIIETKFSLWARPNPNSKAVYTQHRLQESYRRRLFASPIKHGPTRRYNQDGNLYFEERWNFGMRHGPYRRWDWESGKLAAELTFDRNQLTRIGDTAVEDFLPRLVLDHTETGSKLRTALQEEDEFWYENVPLSDVLHDLSVGYGIHFRIDTRALAEAEIPIDSPVTVRTTAPLFAGLCEIVSPLRLTCHYRYESLWLTTPGSDLITDIDRVRGVAANSLLAEKLKQKVGVNGGSWSFDEQLDDLSRRYGISFINEATVSQRAPILARFVSLRSALETLLYNLDLYCEAEGDSLVVRDANDL